MKRLIALLLALCLSLCALPALAEDVCTLDAASPGTVYTDRSYVRVLCAEVSGDVTLSASDAQGSLIYQKAYGACVGSFRSDDLYLPLNGSETVYTITLAEGGQEHSFTVVRRMPRLSGNTACSVGLPLSSVTGRDSWQSVTVLDLRSLEGSALTMPLQASGSYTLGTVTFSVSGGQLTVSAAVSDGIDGAIDSARVYVAANALEAQQLGGKSFSGLTGSLDSEISVAGLDYAVVYVKLTVSFDPADVPAAPKVTQPGQTELWQVMENSTINEAVG